MNPTRQQLRTITVSCCVVICGTTVLHKVAYEFHVSIAPLFILDASAAVALRFPPLLRLEGPEGRFPARCVFESVSKRYTI